MTAETEMSLAVVVKLR